MLQFVTKCYKRTKKIWFIICNILAIVMIGRLSYVLFNFSTFYFYDVLISIPILLMFVNLFFVSNDEKKI